MEAHPPPVSARWIGRSHIAQSSISAHSYPIPRSAAAATGNWMCLLCSARALECWHSVAARTSRSSHSIDNLTREPLLIFCTPSPIHSIFCESGGENNGRVFSAARTECLVLSFEFAYQPVQHNRNSQRDKISQEMADIEFPSPIARTLFKGAVRPPGSGLIHAMFV